MVCDAHTLALLTVTGSLKRFVQDHVKMAFKRVGDFTLVLTGSIDDPDSTMLTQLDQMYASIRLFNGSFELLARKVPNRAALMNEITKIGRSLEPLHERHFRGNLMRSFSSLPTRRGPSGGV
jgi:hypothetical protein